MVSDSLGVKKKKIQPASLLPQIAIWELWPRGARHSRAVLGWQENWSAHPETEALGRLGMQWTSSRSVCQRVGGGGRLGEGQGVGCYGDWWGGGENWHIVAEGWARAPWRLVLPSMPVEPL